MAQYGYGVIGRLAEGKNAYGGQTIKTRNFTEELESFLGKEKVYRGDTSGWQKKPVKLVRQLWFALRNCENVVILPAPNGVRVFPRLLMLLRGRRKTKLQYVVVGGWLPSFLEKKKSLARCLKKFDGIFVETQTMKAAMEKLGFTNVSVLPNFKRIRVLTEEELVYAEGEPYKLCTFSRVLKEKGIEDAIEAVKSANEKMGRTAYALDIYGRVDPGYEEAFAEICKTIPENIRYMGAADGSKSTEIIKDYFALLFPTYYAGEGYPGTLLDAFAAGVPVIASDWRYNAEVVEDRGFMFETQNVDALCDVLERLISEPEIANEKKKKCLEYAATMQPQEIIQNFCKKSDNNGSYKVSTEKVV